MKAASTSSLVILVAVLLSTGCGGSGDNTASTVAAESAKDGHDGGWNHDGGWTGNKPAGHFGGHDGGKFEVTATGPGFLEGDGGCHNGFGGYEAGSPDAPSPSTPDAAAF